MTMSAGRPSRTKKTSTVQDLTALKDPVRMNFDLERTERGKLKAYAAKNDTTVGALLRAYVATLPE